MSLPILIDMNLSADWVPFLEEVGWPALRWSSVGEADADDEVLFARAAARKQVVFTNDLDFGTLLALTHALEPSVLLVRAQRVLPEHIGRLVLSALRRYETELASGALVVLEDSKSRVRVLPF